MIKSALAQMSGIGDIQNKIIKNIDRQDLTVWKSCPLTITSC